jgi:hypothetical protein
VESLQRARTPAKTSVFPISNWTELDCGNTSPASVWKCRRSISRTRARSCVAAPLVPVTELTPPRKGEVVENVSVRFRGGRHHLHGPVASEATTVEAIIAETAATTITERGATRLDDQTNDASMELRKKEGYFDVRDRQPTHPRPRRSSLPDGGQRRRRQSTLIGRLPMTPKRFSPTSCRHRAHAAAARADARPVLTDGLVAEREQGITIDVAYRYFATALRNFIIADAPGHEQYTRNMVTAASTAQLAILLVDARHGVVTQTRRHATLAHLVGIRSSSSRSTRWISSTTARMSTRASSTIFSNLPSAPASATCALSRCRR